MHLFHSLLHEIESINFAGKLSSCFRCERKGSELRKAERHKDQEEEGEEEEEQVQAKVLLELNAQNGHKQGMFYLAYKM